MSIPSPGTSANVHDVTQAHKLMRDGDKVRCGDSGCFGIVKRYCACRKTSHRVIAKNMNKFFVLFGCANLNIRNECAFIGYVLL